MTPFPTLPATGRFVRLDGRTRPLVTRTSREAVVSDGDEQVMVALTRLDRDFSRTIGARWRTRRVQVDVTDDRLTVTYRGHPGWARENGLQESADGWSCPATAADLTDVDIREVDASVPGQPPVGSPLHRVLSPQESDLLAAGSSLLEGIVVDSSAVNEPTDDPHVDVLHLRRTPLMLLERLPADEDATARPSCWRLAPTRVPIGAEVWRHRHGEPVLLRRFAGGGAGWEPSDGFAPPPPWVGPRMRHRGMELPVDLVPQSDELDAVAVGPVAPARFRTVRPRIHVARLPTDCAEEVAAVDLLGTCDGIKVQLIERHADIVVVRVATAAEVAALDGRTLSPHVHEVRVRADRVRDVHAVRRLLVGEPDRVLP